MNVYASLFGPHLAELSRQNFHQNHEQLIFQEGTFVACIKVHAKKLLKSWIASLLPTEEIWEKSLATSLVILINLISATVSGKVSQTVIKNIQRSRSKVTTAKPVRKPLSPF